MTTPNHRKQRANNSREHILDTYVDLLIRSGERAATLDAVATAAKVSKGGLLYHFSSKKALLEALAERTLTLAEEDFAAMEQAPEGASAYYINSSTPDNTPFDRALIALSRLTQNNNELAQQTLARVQEGWHSLILAELGDERIARAVLLLGDGMYYNAAFGGGSANPQTADMLKSDRAALERALQVLKAAVIAN
ncbi:TetR/AcrR family transcriptional regulator [Rothia sp. HMSC072E10]|uniref:TetR/AcrR family transcriptional regulator n=1 Tax=Rothia sp. HMSC072E10 TaxID=1739448 RepID=UPI0008A26130|nr:TetR/AcrR family transcriptional regulator [Rothia sp. HMSC072E10]OFQ29758.1 TetR family transcriptional regulator [Rothia sp. HMSC072E10]